MRADLQTILTDIKAAARIGHAESLWVALDGLFDFPEVAGNPPMSAAFIRQAILPIGKALTHPRVTAPTLRPLVNHDHAAIRAIAAVTLANQYCSGERVGLKDLSAHGRDPRKGVRKALVFALNQAGKGNSDKLQTLIQSWIIEDSPRLNAVALQLLPALAELDPSQTMELLGAFQPSGDPEVRTSLVDCLVELAQGELTDEVLTLLEGWATTPGNNLWVIGKTLSRSWVIPYADRGLEIITRIATQHGPEKTLLKTLKAMGRHGADQAITQAIERWREDPNPNLQALAKLMTEKSGA
jgi:hypothetical protein